MIVQFAFGTELKKKNKIKQPQNNNRKNDKNKEIESYNFKTLHFPYAGN